MPSLTPHSSAPNLYNPELLSGTQRLSWSRQVAVVTHRGFLNYLRNPKTFLVRIFQNIAFFIILVSLYFRRGATLDQTAPRDLAGVLFFAMITRSFAPVLTTILSFAGYERNAFLREHHAGLYSTSAFYLGKTIAETPFQVVGGIFLPLVIYYIIGLNPGFVHYVFFNLVLLIAALLFQALGLFFAINFSVRTGQALSPVLIVIFMLSSGIFIAPANFDNIWIGLQYVSPFRYDFEALVRNEFEGRVFYCKPNQYVKTPFGELCPITTGEQALALYGHVLNFWLLVGILIGMMVFVHLGNYLLLRFRKWDITEQ